MAPVQIAHRGLWWPFRSEQNTLPVLLAALKAGYGVETDVRRSPTGMLVLAHDVEQTGSALPLIEFLSQVDRRQSLPLLFDIKEPEVIGDLVKTLERFGLFQQSYLFDFELIAMSQLPDFPRPQYPQCLKRRSDRYEVPISYGTYQRGIWLDQFDSDWVTPSTLEMEKQLAGQVFVVSSELHGRVVDLTKILSWKSATGICTDLPHLFEQIFQEEGVVHPTDPWWKV